MRPSPPLCDAARDAANARLEEISAALRSDPSAVSPAAARAWADELADMAPLTWYACRCSSVNPTLKIADAVCPVCGELRKLPPRLACAPWPLYVACLPRVFPDWFSRLARALTAKNLLASADAARLTCIDGLIADAGATVRNIPWIALPMPNMHELDAFGE